MQFNSMSVLGPATKFEEGLGTFIYQEVADVRSCQRCLWHHKFLVPDDCINGLKTIDDHSFFNRNYFHNLLDGQTYYHD